MPRAPDSFSFLELAAAFLAPMFLGAGAANMAAARVAALEAVEAYGARTWAELMSIAQTVAFGLAVMDNLMISFAPDVSLTMKVRLRSGANGLHRSARQTRQGSDKYRRDDALQQANVARPALPRGEAGRLDGGEVSQAEVDAAVEPAQPVVAEAPAWMRAGRGPAEQTVARPPAPANATGPLAAQPVAARPLAAALVGAEAGVEPVAAGPASAEPAPDRPTRPSRPAAQPVAAEAPAFSGSPAEWRAGRGRSTGLLVNEESNRLMWASAMTKVAGDVSRDESTPPMLRASNKLWADALVHHASDLAAGSHAVPQPVRLGAAGASRRGERPVRLPGVEPP